MPVEGHEHADADAPGGVDALFHAHGLRVTAQRRRVLAALAAGAHLTPDDVAASVAADGGDALPASTVYRTLDALEEIGLVTHTHLTHGAPTYHLAGQSDHIHLVCRTCGDVGSVPLAVADDLAATLRSRLGFAAELQHMGIHGTCARCLDAEPADPAGPSHEAYPAGAAETADPADPADPTPHPEDR